MRKRKASWFVRYCRLKARTMGKKVRFVRVGGRTKAIYYTGKPPSRRKGAWWSY